MSRQQSPISHPVAGLSNAASCVGAVIPRLPSGRRSIRRSDHWNAEGKRLAMSLDASGGISPTQAQGEDHVGAGGALVHGRRSHSPLPHGLLQQPSHCLWPAHIQGLCKGDAGASILIMRYLLSTEPHLP